MDGGKIDILNIFALSLVAFFNIVNQVHMNKDIIGRAVYTVPFIFLILIVVLFRKNRYINSFIYLLIAIGTTIDPNNISDYSGSIFFIFSFHLIKSNIYALFVMFTSIICITIRSIVFKDMIPGNLIIILVFSYIYTTYYLLIYRESTNKLDIKNKNLTKEQNEIMNMIGSEGLSQKEIAYKLGISNDVLYNKIYDIRKIYSSGGDIIPLNRLIYEFAADGKRSREKV